MPDPGQIASPAPRRLVRSAQSRAPSASDRCPGSLRWPIVATMPAHTGTRRAPCLRVAASRA